MLQLKQSALVKRIDQIDRENDELREQMNEMEERMEKLEEILEETKREKKQITESLTAERVRIGYGGNTLLFNTNMMVYNSNI